MLTTLLAAFFGNGLYVFLLGVQTIFVVKRNQPSAFLVSLLISTFQLMAYTAVLGQNTSLPVRIAYALGGAVGIVCSIRVYPKLEQLYQRFLKR